MLYTTIANGHWSQNHSLLLVRLCCALPWERICAWAARGATFCKTWDDDWLMPVAAFDVLVTVCAGEVLGLRARAPPPPTRASARRAARIGARPSASWDWGRLAYVRLQHTASS